ncbi:hypothetical protein NDN08_003270 [Rhodosorus marinus]|uniref:Secreted protein n=1 Tax=Rhodosorus marinus TaxID=101924 RepID=A0AAV8UW60_9RHOD|nr:hypothetical protein NDN08_003270 [Rhodosorus marinus]
MGRMGRGRGIILLVLVFVFLLGVAYGGGQHRSKIGDCSRGVKASSRRQGLSGKYGKTTQRGPSYRAQRPAGKMKMETKYHKMPGTNLKRQVRTRRATRGVGSRIWTAFNNFRERRARTSYVA